MNSLVSILVPIYNVQAFIESCAKSLFEQSYNNIEFIFVDDCSPDSSIQLLKNVLKQYPERANKVKIIKHNENKGLAGARNTAILNATGDYLLHVDSDDFIEKNTIEVLIEVAESKSADIVVFDYYLEWKNSRKLVKHQFLNDKYEYFNLVLSAQTENFVVNKLIKRSLYIDNDILHTQGLNFGEDYLVVPKLLHFSNKNIKVDCAFYHYVRYNDNSYTTRIKRKNVEDLIYVYKELSEFLAEQGIDKKSLFLGCMNKKFELIRDSRDIENFRFIRNEFIIENQDLILEDLSGIKKIMLRYLKSEKYFKLLLLTKVYRTLVGMSQIVKNRK